MILSATSLTILIIEDNSGDSVLIEDYLRDELEQPVIHYAKTYQEAKHLLSTNQPYSAILLDLSLPDKSGEDLVNSVIELASLTPVIVLTGYTDKDLGISTLSLGVSDYLLKDELNSLQLYKSILYSIERKRIGIALIESESKYRHLFHFCPMPMWVYEVGSCRFLNVNDAAIRHYGYSREEFLNLTVRDIRPPEDVHLFEKAVIEQTMTGAFHQGVFRHTKKNGKIIHVDIQSNQILFDGKIARMVLATDVSDRIAYINEIEEKNKKLREIAWVQSHVVRAPLARIMGLIDLLKNDNSNSEHSAEVLKYIFQSANELDTVIRDIVNKTDEVENPPFIEP